MVSLAVGIKVPPEKKEQNLEEFSSWTAYLMQNALWLSGRPPEGLYQQL